MIPRSIAATTAAVRSSTPSLANTCSRWVLTVASLMNRAAAMSALLGRLELQDDADEALGESVVDVAGQALALGRC